MTTVPAGAASRVTPTGIVRAFTCTACGCLCDDLTLELDAERITRVSPPCPLAEAFLMQATPALPGEAFVDGKPADLDAAVAAAAEILGNARFPLVMGLDRATCETQRLAVELADRLGAWIDPTDPFGRSRSYTAVQTAGAITATLGEVAARSEMVVYWRADPRATHPRHIERYATRTVGGSGAESLPPHVVVVDERRTETAAGADTFIQIKPGSGIAGLHILRSIVRGLDCEASAAATTGVELAAWRALGERLRGSRYPAIFFELGGGGADRVLETESITDLVRDLHRHTRAVALPMGKPWNAAGAVQVLTWQTGFPGGICFHRGYPRYLPGEAEAARLLVRGEADAALVVGADPLGGIARSTSHARKPLKLVVVDDQVTETSSAAAVAIYTARFGIETSGAVYRSDGVSLPQRAALKSMLPQPEEALRRLVEATHAGALPWSSATEPSSSPSMTP